MNIPLEKLQHVFSQKPLLVGGKAMEYYGLRQSGSDIDLLVPQSDVLALIKQYPDRVKDLWGDLGVCPFEFEIWQTICFFDYDFYKAAAIETEDFFVISREKLLFMKALALKKEKYLRDVELIAGQILKDQLNTYEDLAARNGELLKDIPNISYLQKTGPKPM
jgi:hypothetical protein